MSYKALVISRARDTRVYVKVSWVSPVKTNCACLLKDAFKGWFAETFGRKLNSRASGQFLRKIKCISFVK